MTFSEEQKRMFLPQIDSQMTFKQYLDTLEFTNYGVDYGTVMQYDSTEAESLDVFIKSMMQNDEDGV